VSDFAVWEPGLPVECVLCGQVRGGADPPGPWFRHRPSHRRRIPIYDGRFVVPGRALGYLEYVQL
jgi:hypothetical protein